MLHVGGAVAVALTALLADEWFFQGTERADVLESGVLLQKPNGGECRHAGGTTEHLVAEKGGMD